MNVLIEKLSDHSTQLVEGVTRITDKPHYLVIETPADGTRVLVKGVYLVTEV